jgi:hypothetical protein
VILACPIVTLPVLLLKNEYRSRWVSPAGLGASTELALYAEPDPDLAQAKKAPGPISGDWRINLVTGARLSNYMQIEIEPFPLVA